MPEDDLHKQLDYYRGRLDELSGQIVRADSIVSRAKRELRQRRSALALVSELQRAITPDLSRPQVFEKVIAAVLSGLKMDRAIVLERDSGGLDNITDDLLRPPAHLLVNSATPPDDRIAPLLGAIAAPYFIAVPVVEGEQTTALLIAGRLREAKPYFPPLDDGDVSTLQSIAGTLGAALHNSALYARVRRMADSFARFVPAEFLRLLGRESMVDVELGDQLAADMTVLFSDIRSFTTLSERMTPRENFDFLNQYLRHAAPVIQAHGGFIDKYIGDAIMALFPGEADDAIRAAVALHQAARDFSAELQANAEIAPRMPRGIHIGVGLHSGPLMLGTIGFAGRMESTVISDAVNLASRMEGLSKHYGAGVITTGQTTAKMNDPAALAWRIVDKVQVVGKSKGVEVVEVYEPDLPETRALKNATADAYARALAQYQQGDFTRAAAGFEQIGAANPADKAASLMAGRCIKYTMNPPENWRGITPLDQK